MEHPSFLLIRQRPCLILQEITNTCVWQNRPIRLGLRPPSSNALVTVQLPVRVSPMRSGSIVRHKNVFSRDDCLL